jgi:hypothetical protein
MQEFSSWFQRLSRLLLIVCLIGVSTQLSASNRLRTAALSGQSAPDTGDNFSGFTANYSPSLNNLGQVAFIGQVGTEHGIWTEGGGSGLKLVALSGQQAAGAAVGVNFSNFQLLHGPVLSDGGHTAFLSGLSGDGVTSTNNMGIWRELNGEMSLVAKKGSNAPGTSSNFASFLGGPDTSAVGLLLNKHGHVAFSAVAGTDGIWIERESELELVARAGDPAPGSATTFTYLHSVNGPVMNNLGQVAFIARHGTIVGESRAGVWSDRGGSGLELMYDYAEPAPGLPDGYAFINFDFHPGFNSLGQLAFTGSAIFAIPRPVAGVWSEGRGHGLELIAASGHQAPDTLTGVNFASSPFSERILNSRGETAFLSQLTGLSVTSSNNTALWSEGGGNGLKLLAREGQQAPGAQTGVVFGNFIFSDVPILNANGQAAFTGLLTGPGVTSQNNRGIWAQDLNGIVHLIARTGDLLDVSDDPLLPDFRTISTLNFQTRSGNDDGKRSGFNNRGQVAFRARFTDGSQGIFVSDLVAVPEPGAFAMAITTLIILFSARCKPLAA